MASSLGFPASPTIGQQHTVGTKVYSWDGTVWNSVSSGGGTTLTQEEIQDFVAPLLAHSSHSNITATYNDDLNKIILSSSGGGGAADIGLIIGLS
jgi:hypothetical protein